MDVQKSFLSQRLAQQFMDNLKKKLFGYEIGMTVTPTKGRKEGSSAIREEKVYTKFFFLIHQKNKFFRSSRKNKSIWPSIDFFV